MKDFEKIITKKYLQTLSNDALFELREKFGRWVGASEANFVYYDERKCDMCDDEFNHRIYGENFGKKSK